MASFDKVVSIEGVTPPVGSVAVFDDRGGSDIIGETSDGRKHVAGKTGWRAQLVHMLLGVAESILISEYKKRAG